MWFYSFIIITNVSFCTFLREKAEYEMYLYLLSVFISIKY